MTRKRCITAKSAADVADGSHAHASLLRFESGVPAACSRRAAVRPGVGWRQRLADGAQGRGHDAERAAGSQDQRLGTNRHDLSGRAPRGFAVALSHLLCCEWFAKVRIASRGRPSAPRFAATLRGLLQVKKIGPAAPPTSSDGIISVGVTLSSLAARSKTMLCPRPASPFVDRYAVRFRGETRRRACRIRICSLASGLAATIRPASDRRT
jgi:hypothetical protein